MEVDQVLERMRLLAGQAVERDAKTATEARAKLAQICEAPTFRALACVVQAVNLEAYEAADRILGKLPACSPEDRLLAETLLDPEATELLGQHEIFTLGEALRRRAEELAALGVTHEQLMQLRMLGRRYVANYQRQQTQLGVARRA